MRYTIVQVALLAEGVDRNLCMLYTLRVRKVALLAEGVDRNPGALAQRRDVTAVALLAEGVDRNFLPRPGWLILRCRPPRGGRG